MKGLTVADIAARIGGEVQGGADAIVQSVAGLREARPTDISFLANPKYVAYVKNTKAAAVLVRKDFSDEVATSLIRVDNPDAAFAQVASWFTVPPPEFALGIHPSAVISDQAQIGEGVYIGPHCVVEAGAVIADRCALIAQVYIGHDVQLGADSRIYPNVTIREGCRVGLRAIVHSSSVIGGDGFGYSVDEKGVRTKIPQLGIVEIGDDVEVGSAVTIDRARFGRTVIGNGVKIDNLCMIAHNCVIGDHAVIVSQVGISGSTVVGRHSILAGQVGVAGHLVIGDQVVAEARAGITKDIPSGQMVYGFPAAPRAEAARIHAHVQRLPKLKEKVADLEARLKELESR